MDPVPAAYVEAAREQVAIAAGRLREIVIDRLGLDAADPATAVLLDHVEGDLLDDPDAAVTIAFPDVMVHVPALTAGIVLTHRLSAAEHVEGYLDVDTDLAGFLRVPEPHVGGEPLEFDDEQPAWGGPPDWLADLPLDALLAVRVAADGAVDVAVLDDEPGPAPGAVAALRHVYDVEVAEPGLPVTAEMLVVGMLLADRQAFARPLPPLSELAAAAGLQQRGDEFAHDAAVWANAAEVDRRFRTLDRLGTGPEADAALEALDLLTGRGADPAALRRALDLMELPDVLVVVVDELLDELLDGPGGGDAERVAALVALADRLLAAAGRTRRAAVAGWIATVAAERDGRVLDAESHLRAAAVAGAGWELVEDRLAAYESDRGDAAAALGRWASIAAEGAGPDDDPDVVAVRPFAQLGPEPGRNEPCPCGSGRKFKQCHLGRTTLPPLAERVGWLYRKAVGYLERRGGAVTDLLDLYEVTLAGPDADPDTFDDEALVADAMLDESGWGARFVADRGPLLPADERELAVSWTAVQRSVFEVLDGGQVRDVRTGARLPTTGPTAAAGARICARALPDGAGRHVLVAVVAVDRELEEELLAVLAGRDALELLDLLAPDAREPRAVLHTEPARPSSPVAVPAVVRQLQERRERRWCDEPAPALDGRTPRQAAADPTRRDAVLALIATVPPDDPSTGKLGLRPTALRDLLGLT